MSDSLQSLFPVIYAGLAEFPRKQFGILRAVQVDSGLINGKPSRGALGQEVVWDVPQIGQPKNIAPAHNVPEADADVPAMRSFKLEKRRGISIQVTGATSEVLGNARLQNQYLQAMDALTLELETYLATKVIEGASRAFLWSVTSEGTTSAATPFTSANDLSYFAELNDQFKTNHRANGKLSLILNSGSAKNLRSYMTNLWHANEFGSRELIAEGVVNMIQGFRIHEPVDVPTLPTQSSGSNYVTDGAHAKGVTSIKVDTGSGEIKAGTLVLIGGKAYGVTKGIAAAGVFEIAEPGLLANVADGSAITNVGSGYSKVNIGLAGGAVGLGVRLPEAPAGGDAASEAVALHDPHTGLVFEIRRYKRYRMVVDEIAIMYGATVLDNAGVILGLTA